MRSFRKCLAASLPVFAVIFILTGMLILFTLAYLECRFHGKNRTNLPPASKFLQPDKTTFKVAVFGDFSMQSNIFVPIIHDINRQDVDFVVSAGDMLRKTNRAEGDYLLELLQDNLKLPWVSIPGNHDLTKEKGSRYYESYFGQSYYFFGYGNTLFIALNNADHHINKQQMQWLEQVLKTQRSLFKRCVLFMHIPPTSFRGMKYGGGPWSSDLANVLRPYAIDAIVSGHLHIAECGVWNGIPVFISPSAGQKQRDTKNPDFGYMVLTFPETGNIVVNYHHIPGLERGRNYVLCALVNDAPGNPNWLLAAAAAILIGLLLLFLGKRKFIRSGN